MHITFVGFGWEQLGLAQLSAIARQHGHTVGLAFSAGLFDDRYNLRLPFFSGIFREDDQVLKEIQCQNPDILIFSPLTATYQWMLMIAGRAKELLPGVVTVFGGVHVSAVPERVIQRSEVDYLCVGEGDRAFVEILDAVQRGIKTMIDNVWFRDDFGRIVQGGRAPFLQNLDVLPTFDKTLWEDIISFKDIYFTMASRGCPYQCTYCFNDYFSGLGSGRYIRYRSPEHVVRELEWAVDRYQLRLIEFEDDVFTLNRAWLQKLLHLYKKEIDLPFQCLTHPKYMNDDVARMLKEAGCLYVQMGVQSMDDSYKRDVLRRPETRQDVERALQSMKRYGLNVKIDHMFALPGEPLDAQKMALDMYQRYPPYRMQTFWMNYFPKTSILDYAQKYGSLSQSDKEMIEEGKISDDYRNSSKINDAAALRFYKAYECVFKLLTVLPQSWTKYISIELFMRLPSPVLSAVSFCIDLAAGLGKKNPDHWCYAKHYLFHMKRVLLQREPHRKNPERIDRSRPMLIPTK